MKQVLDQFNPRTDPYIRAYQDAQDKAHELADKAQEPHLVIKIGPEEFEVQPESQALVPQKKIRYTAQPGTITYRSYKEQARAAGYSIMTLEEWTKQGRLSIEAFNQKYGLKTTAEKAEEKRIEKDAKDREAGRTVKAHRAKISGKSNKVIVFEAVLAGEYDLEKLMELTQGNVKLLSLKSWISSWSRGLNFPAGLSGKINPLPTAKAPATKKKVANKKVKTNKKVKKGAKK